MNRHFLSITAAGLLLAILAAASVSAQSNIPQMINYQGYLTDAQGKPVATDTYTLSFSIYATADGTTPVWGPKVMEDVPVVDGNFNVILGPTDKDGKSIVLAFTGPEAYLGIKVEKQSDEGEGTVVGGDIMPRQRILSTPYAMQAEHSAFDVPIGAIIPWIPPSKTIAAEKQLPRGFKICLGAQTDDTSTPFDEARIPDLTTRFLVGVVDGEIGKVGGRKDIPSDGSHNHTGYTSYVDDSGVPKENGNDGRHVHRHRHEISADGSHNHGGDNLPPYYGVIMIIRVF